jgi:hypothetical protein
MGRTEADNYSHAEGSDVAILSCNPRNNLRSDVSSDYCDLSLVWVLTATVLSPALSLLRGSNGITRVLRKWTGALQWSLGLERLTNNSGGGWPSNRLLNDHARRFYGLDPSPGQSTWEDLLDGVKFP